MLGGHPGLLLSGGMLVTTAAAPTPLGTLALLRASLFGGTSRGILIYRILGNSLVFLGRSSLLHLRPLGGASTSALPLAGPTPHLATLLDVTVLRILPLAGTTPYFAALTIALTALSSAATLAIPGSAPAPRGHPNELLCGAHFALHVGINPEVGVKVLGGVVGLLRLTLPQI